VGDDVSGFEGALGAGDPDQWHTVLWWSGGGGGDGDAASGASDAAAASPKVEAKSRTLAMLAIQHNALRVLALLLSKGANPRQRTKDGGGLSCYEVRRARRGARRQLGLHALRAGWPPGAITPGPGGLYTVGWTGAGETHTGWAAHTPWGHYQPPPRTPSPIV
jgi:hypothetical protein